MLGGCSEVVEAPALACTRIDSRSGSQGSAKLPPSNSRLIGSRIFWKTQNTDLCSNGQWPPQGGRQTETGKNIDLLFTVNVHCYGTT